MNPSRRVCRVLDDEHRTTMELLARVQHAAAGGDPPALPRLGATLARALEHEIGRHFDFEEQQLFPRLHEGGAGDLATLLLEEHGTLRAVAGELLPLARRAAAGETLAAGDLAAMRRTALEWVERLEAHIEKETMALLPALEEVLDASTDGELAVAYAETA
jgi:hemerythrin-like domain-containing protein